MMYGVSLCQVRVYFLDFLLFYSSFAKELVLLRQLVLELDIEDLINLVGLFLIIQSKSYFTYHHGLRVNA